MIGAEMTVEELKKVADEMGYSLVKKQSPMPKLRKCTCGRKPHEWIRCGKNGGKFYGCDCGQKAAIGKNRRERILNWNQMIESDSR